MYNKINKNIIYTIFIFVYSLGLAQPSNSQQTVFNVPSADVTPKGKIFLQQESQFRPYKNNSYWWGTEYMAVGVGHNTELTATLFNVSTPTSDNISLGVGFKSAIPIPKLDSKFPNQELKLIIGNEVLASMQGLGAGNWTYAALSGRVPKIKTRITGGFSSGSRLIFGNDTVCFIGAIEQPITKKFEAVADWFSGDEHYAGFLIAGGSYKLPKNNVIFFGYQIPNSPKVGDSGFIIEVSKIF